MPVDGDGLQVADGVGRGPPFASGERSGADARSWERFEDERDRAEDEPQCGPPRRVVSGAPGGASLMVVCFRE